MSLKSWGVGTGNLLLKNLKDFESKKDWLVLLFLDPECTFWRFVHSIRVLISWSSHRPQ